MRTLYVGADHVRLNDYSIMGAVTRCYYNKNRYLVTGTPILSVNSYKCVR